jgi:hypothetical protein
MDTEEEKAMRPAGRDGRGCSYKPRDASSQQKLEETRGSSSPEPLEGAQPRSTVDFSPVIPMYYFFPAQLQQNGFLLL